MQKWKQDYLSQKQRLNKDESGITLVELLAAISILFVVILLAGAIHMFGQRQFIHQTESASQANDLSYALTVMSTDLRKQEPAQVIVNEEGNKISVADGTEYYVLDNQLYKGNTVLAKSVDTLRVEKIEEALKIILQSSSQSNQNKKYETTIYFRGIANAEE